MVIIWSPSLKHPRQEKSALLDLTSIAQLFFQIFRQEETGKKAGKTGNISEVRKFNRKNIWDASHANIFWGGEMDSMERKYNTRTVRAKNCAKTISGKLK